MQLRPMINDPRCVFLQPRWAASMARFTPLSTLVVAIVAFAAVAAADPPGEATTLHASQLKSEVDAAVSRHELRETKEAIQCADGMIVATAQLYVGPRDVPRKYGVTVGSSDSIVSTSYYYDSSGILRFIQVEQSVYNGTRREIRMFYDAAGVRAGTEDQLLSGPGWTYGTTEEIRDPKGALSSFRSSADAYKQVCGEG